jgi:hypothetical protein
VCAIIIDRAGIDDAAPGKGQRVCRFSQGSSSARPSRNG